MQQSDKPEENWEDNIVEYTNKIWVDSIVHSKSAGQTIEADFFGSPPNEYINRHNIATRGNQLYFIPQHRNILHIVLLCHIQGNDVLGKVSHHYISIIHHTE